VTVAYAQTRDVDASRVLRLGLRAPRPVDPGGVRLAHRLLVDGAGPLYVSTDPDELRAAALEALRALDAHGARG
jgi:hypothetical protein